MRSITKQGLMALCLISSNVFAGTQSEFNRILDNFAFFYQHPSKETFEQVQQGILKFKEKIPKHNRLQLLVWADKVSNTYHWQLNTDFFPEGMHLLRDEQSKMARFVADDKAINPLKLDIWWASFSATGDGKYVYNVFEQAIMDDQKDLNLALIKEAAKWSFTSNCRQHEKIRGLARAWQQEVLSQGGKELLSTCINSAKP